MGQHTAAGSQGHRGLDANSEHVRIYVKFGILKWPFVALDHNNLSLTRCLPLCSTILCAKMFHVMQGLYQNPYNQNPYNHNPYNQNP